ILRLPLLRTGGALRELPLEPEQRVEEAVVPLGRRRRPCTFESARRRMTGDAALVAVAPAESELFDIRAFRLRADELRIARAVRLAERMTAGVQRDSLLVI